MSGLLCSRVVLVTGEISKERRLLKGCISLHMLTQSVLAFPPFSASFAEIRMGVGEEVRKGNHANIGNWKYLKKVGKKKVIRV